MIDGRKAVVELCETSRLALYLARLGQGAGLHQVPLFSRSFWESATGSGGVLRESPGLSGFYGTQSPADGHADLANAHEKKKPQI